MKKSASAVAHSNIALIKYWGKRDQKLNLPAVGSISITLDALQTKTIVTLSPDLNSDEFYLAGKRIEGEKAERVIKFLNIIRKIADQNTALRVESINNFPTGAGLASSASAFAALALAGSAALGLQLSPEQLSVLARQGSGSAARSIFGGFAEMKMGNKTDGTDAYATSIADQNFWDLRVLIVITSQEEKKTGSGMGMVTSANTCPYFDSWTYTSVANLDNMRQAISHKDFQKLGELSEHSCLKMHAVMLSSIPALVYWNSITVGIIHHVYELRQKGIPVYFSIDAGPQVKLITLPEFEERIFKSIQSINGIKDVLVSKLGSGAYLEDEA